MSSSEISLTPDEEVVLHPADVSSYTPQHVVTRGQDVFGGGMLPDGRRAPGCIVKFECPRCRGQIELDAYKGVPIHKECPGSPMMVPIAIGMVHAVAHNVQPLRDAGAKRQGGDPV